MTALDLCHTSQWTGSYTLIPVGCSHRPNYCGSHDWHWNTATSGSGRSDTRPVCVKEETETDYCTEGTWCSSAKRENISSLVHLLRGLTRVTYTTNDSQPCHPIVSLTRNNTIRTLRKYLTRASRSNTGTVLSSISDTSCNLEGCSEGYKSSGTATVSCPIGGGSLEYDFTCR